MDDVVNPPLLTADLPGIGGRLKTLPEDFEVEEIPAYPPSGSGDFLYLWIEKRDMGAEFFLRQIAKRLAIAPAEVGSAGLKDRHAVTRQMVSVPVSAEARVGQLDGDGLRVLQVSRHSNKLRAGHLHGNHFRILIREPDPAVDCATVVADIVARLQTMGMPNFYGTQRFGRDGETLHLGLQLLGGRLPAPDAPLPTSVGPGRGARRVNPFLKKLALSAAQSALFNHYLARRMKDGLLQTVLPGDVMAKVPFGGMFVAEDVPTEQGRFDRREIVPAGPIFGRKTFASQGEAALREDATLAAFGLAPSAFNGFGKLVMGTRRHNLIFLQELRAAVEPDGIRLSFSLPAGSYATVLLREVMKREVEGDEAA